MGATFPANGGKGTEPLGDQWDTHQERASAPTRLLNRSPFPTKCNRARHGQGTSRIATRRSAMRAMSGSREVARPLPPPGAAVAGTNETQSTETRRQTQRCHSTVSSGCPIRYDTWPSRALSPYSLWPVANGVCVCVLESGQGVEVRRLPSRLGLTINNRSFANGY